MAELWPAAVDAVTPYFALRAMRYESEFHQTNRLADLEVYLKKFTVRTPVLEVLGSDPLRLTIVTGVAHASGSVVPEMLPDLVAGALARHDFDGAALFLEAKRSAGLAERADILLLAYVHCLRGQVDKAEATAAVLGVDRSDRQTDWMWGKLQAEYGFRPPR